MASAPTDASKAVAPAGPLCTLPAEAAAVAILVVFAFLADVLDRDDMLVLGGVEHDHA